MSDKIISKVGGLAPYKDILVLENLLLGQPLVTINI
jgi:hypothetical protein